MTKSRRGEQNPLDPLAVNDFARYYKALYGYAPFQWQVRLAELACHGDWPGYIKLPTASGKTAAIDIAVFALAYQAAEGNRPGNVMTAARRIFFVVDRRIIVNEAYRRANRTANLLRTTLDSKTKLSEKDAEYFDRLDRPSRELLARVARWLQHLAKDEEAPPLDCFELRGGIYRNDAWVRSPLQPTVLTSTVDQVGSRLLFRGYGVSDRNLPIHAALTANDSLIILDEAHCSKPFSQTMASIARYRSELWAREPVVTPFSFVQMTATPPVDIPQGRVFKLEAADYQADPLLARRHACRKPVRLELATGVRGTKLYPILAKKLADQAITLANEHGLRKIVVVVNRVAIARQVFNKLQDNHNRRVSLMIGRMRPIDRDRFTRELQDQYGSEMTDGNSPAAAVEPTFVVATQCLEVGADLDFDGLVSQCASLDALRQRFGRLNRLGNSPGACGVIVAADGDLRPRDKLSEDKPLDRIYGNASAQTWHWLKDQADERPVEESGAGPAAVVDFGIRNLDVRCDRLGEALSKLLAPTKDAPVLMPAHVDMLCQTAPRPTPEPDVAAHLHGPDRDSPEVRVCCRADLDTTLIGGHDTPEEAWLSAVEVCPPSSAEFLTAPLKLFRQWLRGETIIDETGDVLGEATDPADDVAKSQELSEPTADGKNKKDRQSQSRTVLVWHGKRKQDQERSFCVNGATAGQISPNDTIVIPATLGGWSELGHIPNAPPGPADSERDSRTIQNGRNDISAGQHAAGENDGDFANIDVADAAFFQSRAQTIMRVHPKLRASDPELAPLFAELLSAVENDEADLSVARWKKVAKAIVAANQEAANGNSPSSVRPESPLRRLIDSEGQIVRYRGGLAWITERHIDLKQGILPLPSFGDDDSLSLTGKDPSRKERSAPGSNKVSLKQHLADVYQEAVRLTSSFSLEKDVRSAITEVARLHDIGKAEPRFQAAMLNKPKSVVAMQPTLWAKSEGAGRSTLFDSLKGFRHEMLSLALLDRFEIDETADRELLNHGTASHHGHARPFAPIYLDDSPGDLSLRSLGIADIAGDERKTWPPAHRLDSGVADRFWTLNRRYGWWGLAFVESLVRLSDWCASATPGRGDPDSLTLAPRRAKERPITAPKRPASLVLSGLDSSNPLAFLAALGLFRVISQARLQCLWELSWARHQGAWRPSIHSNSGTLTEERILDLLGDVLMTRADEHPAIRLAAMTESAEMAATTQNLGVRSVFAQVAEQACSDSRSDAGWLSCNGSDLAGPEHISQLQTTRRLPRDQY